MGSFVKFLKDELESKDKEVQRQKNIVMQLKQEIENLKTVQPEAAIRIEGNLENLFGRSRRSCPFPESIHTNNKKLGKLNV